MLMFVLLLISLVFSQSQLLATTYYVSAAGNNGAATSWAAAKTSIQGAINIASNGDVILVKYATYNIASQINLGSKNLRITSDDGTATSWETATPDSSQCIIDANRSGRVFAFDNSAITNSTRIRGFKITGGDGSVLSLNRQMGGGIIIKAGADPIIENCWITDNLACNTTLYLPLAALGGGIFIQGSSPIIQNNLLSGNIGTTVENQGLGGGISVTSNSSPSIVNNIVSGNYATTGAYSENDMYNGNCGGGIYISSSSGTVLGNLIKNNICATRPTYKTRSTYTSNAVGGGMCVEESNVTISNNIFKENMVFGATTGSGGGNPRGGAIYAYSANSMSLTISNNVFYNNKLRNSSFFSYTSEYGQAIYGVKSSAIVKNNIFANHSFSFGDGRAIYTLSSINVSYNCFYENSSSNVNVVSTNELSSSPNFIDAASDNFTLSSLSSCINGGDPASSVPAGGEPIIDIGAIEYIASSSVTVNDVDDSFTGNFSSGQAFAIASTSGTVNYTAQFYLDNPPNSNSKPNVGRYWDISATGDSKIRLYYPLSARSTFTGSPTIFHYNGTSWEVIPTNPEQLEGTSYFVESTNPISSWSNFTVGDSNDPLPVELIAFFAQITENKVLLSWQTATEVNNYGFEVERKTDLVDNWENIGFVDGHGNSNSVKDYSFVDDNPLGSELSYRLKQIDTDGSFEYSEIVTVTSELPLEYKLSQNYPNPFNPSTVIEFAIPTSGNVSLKVFNSLGEEVAELVNSKMIAGYHSVNFNATNLSSGIYFYRISASSYTKTNKMLLIK
jgi:hypothetical protein